ncbi:hypothetical protein H2198_002871 [Neophaeococcomyces mojaviensis]|uniref:Uncharacterized protein n=1 Tax=Neophaeococcomyces mojaviensis TaxID=3383035 RepID=A0ACC3ACQ7_9EURO|nr:hypothetical protein H2198_002871 [Knufia sp. JES_112]
MTIKTTSPIQLDYQLVSRGQSQKVSGGNTWARDTYGRRYLVRTPNSSYDDILSGYAKNEAWGRYSAVLDPRAQAQATQQLAAQNIVYYDWAYHKK